MGQCHSCMLSNSKMEPGNQENNTEYCKRYYQLQTIHTLGESTDRFLVPIWIATNISSRRDIKAKTTVKNVHESWIDHLKKTIEDINVAAPGLHLYQVDSESDDHKISIYGIKGKEAYTRMGDISEGKKSHIYLGDRRSHKNRTSTHEILHALGFEHEHQRYDAPISVDEYIDEIDSEEREQIDKKSDVIGLTRFDPFSIMLYSECKLKRKPEDDPIWVLKETKDINIEMSELDKVGLNIVYKPCEHDGYQPEISPVTGLYYCGRKVMTRHNYPWENTTDGFCGPNNWSNCPACRVLKTDRMDEIFKEDKWQGWSGLVYCGKWFGVQDDGHDGYCGPDNGPPCPECANILNPA